MMAAPTRANVRSFMVGLIALATAGFVTYVAAAAASGLPWSSTTEVKAAFDNVATLQPGNEVRENSVRIGRVSDISYEGDQAIVTMQLDGDVDVFSDARAAIWDQSVLAKRFVELHRGHAKAGGLGDKIIGKRQTLGATDLADVLDIFDARTRKALSGTLKELGGGAAGHSRDLHAVLNEAPSLLGDVRDVMAALTSPEADLPTVLRNAERLAGAFTGHEKQVTRLVAQADNTLRAVAVDGGQPLRTAVNMLPTTMRTVRSNLAKLDRPLADADAALSQLGPGIRSLSEATPDVRGVLRESVSPLRKLPGVARQASPAVAGLSSTVSDARPLAPRLSEGLVHVATPLSVLAPYSQEIRTFFDRANSFVSTKLGPGKHVARLAPVVQGHNLVSGGVVEDKTLPRNAYPAPGEADRDRAESPLPNAETGGN